MRISDWSSDVCSSDLQHRQAELGLEVLEQGENLRLHRDIQCRNGLVGDEDFRIERQGPGDADALALAAGKFMRIALDGAGIEADQQIGRESCKERGSHDVLISVVADSLTKKKHITYEPRE